MIQLDTSVLIDALTGRRPLLARLHAVVAAGERLALSSLVLFEWLRGPRLPEEVAAQEALLPATAAIPFGPAEAATAAAIYREIRRARGREADVAIAATAIAHGASLWTVNDDDFGDIPGLVLFDP